MTYRNLTTIAFASFVTVIIGFCNLGHASLISVFSDDFSSGTLDQWTVVSGTATVDTGRMSISENSTVQSAGFSRAMEDEGSLTLDVRTSGNFSGLRVGLVDSAGNGYGYILDSKDDGQGELLSWATITGGTFTSGGLVFDDGNAGNPGNINMDTRPVTIEFDWQQDGNVLTYSWKDSAAGSYPVTATVNGTQSYGSFTNLLIVNPIDNRGNDFVDNVTALTVPEPTSLALLGLGGLALLKRRRTA